MISYHDLIQDIIENESSMIGPVAVQKAKEVPGLYLDKDGNVTELEGDEIEILGNLVKKYESVVGQAIASAIRAEKEKGDLPELPENVQKYLE